MNRKINGSILVILGILVLISCPVFADQVNDTRFLPVRPGSDQVTGFQTIQRPVQVTISPINTVDPGSPLPGSNGSFNSRSLVPDSAIQAVPVPDKSTAVVTTVDSSDKVYGSGDMSRIPVPATHVLSRQVTGPDIYGDGTTVPVTSASHYNVENVAGTGILRNDAESLKGKVPVSQSGSKLLLGEAEREFSRMTSSYYTHTTYVNEKSGIYNYDCSGFVGYALSKAVPQAFNALNDKRPTAAEFYYYIVQCGPNPGTGGWMRVATPRELHPGDIVVWLKPDSSDSTSTGHVMIVTGYPSENPARPGEVLVQVMDSALSGHADDTRESGETGLGKGTIGIMTGSSGQPTGFYWRGGASTLLQETEIAFARIA